jgi:hypothetical protein
MLATAGKRLHAGGTSDDLNIQMVNDDTVIEGGNDQLGSAGVAAV